MKTTITIEAFEDGSGDTKAALAKVDEILRRAGFSFLPRDESTSRRAGVYRTGPAMVNAESPPELTAEYFDATANLRARIREFVRMRNRFTTLEAAQGVGISVVAYTVYVVRAIEEELRRAGFERVRVRSTPTRDGTVLDRFEWRRTR